MIEEVLNDVYRGKCNMCIAAEKAGVQLEELKHLLREYLLERPLDFSDPGFYAEELQCASHQG